MSRNASEGELMCRTDIDGDWACGSSKIRRARKSHKCSECERTIEPGEQYRYETCVYEGFPSSTHICIHCEVPRSWLGTNCGTYQWGDIYADVEEHGLEYAALSLPMMRIAVGMRRKWLRFDGAGLMPIPRMPPSIPDITAEQAA